MMSNDDLLDAAMRQNEAERSFSAPNSDEAASARARLDELILSTEKNAGAAFQPDALALLSALKKDDKAMFESVRAKLKDAGCRVTELDGAIVSAGGGADRRPTQADTLIQVALSAAELFHDSRGAGYADLDISGHRETWQIRSKGFRQWLYRRYYEETRGAPNSEAVQSALGVLEAMARYDAPERVVHIRVGEHDSRLYLDLGDEGWRAVELDAAGWHVVDRPAVRFRRTSGMLPLPAPARGGSIEALRAFLNVRSDADFVLVVAWLLAALRHRGPFPVLALSGEQGSAKSTFSAILRALLDPNTAPLRALPREDRDLFIAATNGHVLAFDNVSGLAAWISDTLCRLATGGGFAVRALFTDQDEVLFDAARPVILNGIEDVVTRPDLADRAIFLTLQPIPEDRRRPEQELWADFEIARPHILGALLDAVSTGLARLPQIRLETLPRMADFALWATACETAVWPAGAFSAAYNGNRDAVVEGVIDGDPVAAAVRAMMATRSEWSGTYSDLLTALEWSAIGATAKSRNWPTSSQQLAGRLRRAATFLRNLGIEISFGREGHGGIRTVSITSTGSVSPEPDNAGSQPSALSAPSPVATKQPVSAKGLAAPLPLTTAGISGDDGDGADSLKPASSAAKEGAQTQGAAGWSARL